MSERKVIGRLNPYWAKLMQGLALHYKYPFFDIKEISINTETSEISVIEVGRDELLARAKRHEERLKVEHEEMLKAEHEEFMLKERR